MEEFQELLDWYMRESDIMSASYEMMGMMLNSEKVTNSLRKRNISELYIYGGGYLGIQFFKAIRDNVSVISVVDKSGGLMIDMSEQIPVISLETFENQYQGQTVVITPVKHYHAISNDLQRLVRQDQMLYLGELLGEI